MLHRVLPVTVMTLAFTALACSRVRNVREVTMGTSDTPTRLHMRDGSVYACTRWTHQGGVIEGEGALYNAERVRVREGTFSVRREEVSLIETTESEIRGTDGAIAAMSVVSAASLSVSAFCLSNPKSCFGSCPTFYVPRGGGWTIQAEGFSTSIARTLEADDVDDLPDAVPVDGTVTLAMRDEALETHVTRRVALRVVEGPAGTTPYRELARERYLALGATRAPEGCSDEAVCRSLAARDGDEHTPGSDGEDLARKTSVTLRYAAPGSARVALALTARNSLMNTYVFYHLLALHGRRAPEFLASIERGDPDSLRALAEYDRLLGGVDVDVRQGRDAWQRVGTLPYIGPIARATRAVGFTLNDATQPVEVRLTFARSHWRLDAARLGPWVASDLSAQTVWPEVTDTRGAARDDVALSLRGEGDPLVTQPGDEYTLRFRVGAPRDGVGYFLHARGYYHEWLREVWLRDENLPLARTYVREPERALRELAAEFHRAEPAMESLFEASRFRGREP